MLTWAFLVPEAGFSARPHCLKDEREVPQFANGCGEGRSGVRLHTTLRGGLGHAMGVVTMARHGEVAEWTKAAPC